MAHLLKVIKSLGPKLTLNKTAHPTKVAELMAARTGVKNGEVRLVVEELGEVIVFYNSQGIPVNIPGLGTFFPSMDRNGKVRMNVRFDKALVDKMNGSKFYTGTVVNKSNIGWTNEQFKVVWDEANPDDPMDLS